MDSLFHALGYFFLVFDRDPQGDIERITRDVLTGIAGFTVGLRLWNTTGPMDVALSTDLDARIEQKKKKQSDAAKK